MKIKHFFSINIILIGIIIISLFSCRKDYFQNINAVDASGEWGMPLLNSNIYVEDILRFFGSHEIDEDESTGMLKFSLFIDSTQLIRPTELLSLFSHLYSNSFTFPAPSGNLIPPVNEFQVVFHSSIITEDNFIIEEGIIKSGTLTVDIASNIDQSNYTIVITSPHIFNHNNQSLEVRFTPTHLSQSIDLSDNKIIISDANNPNTISFVTTIYIENYIPTSIDEYSVETQFSFNAVLFRYLKGKMNPKHYPVRFSKPVSIFSNNITGNFKLLNPKYNVRIANSVGASCKFIADSVGFIGTGFYSPVLNSGTELFCGPSAGSGHYEITENSGVGNELLFSEVVKDFLFQGDAIVNPLGLSAGSIFIDEHAELYVSSKVEVNVESKFNYISYRDTMNFTPQEISFLDIIEEATVRLSLTNGIPMSGTLQLYFYDSEKDLIIDTLLVSPQLFREAIVGGPPNYYVTTQTTMPPKYISMSGERYKKIMEADKIIVETKLFSNNPEEIIRIYSNQKINFGLSVKVKYNTNSLEL